MILIIYQTRRGSSDFFTYSLQCHIACVRVNRNRRRRTSHGRTDDISMLRPLVRPCRRHRTPALSRAGTRLVGVGTQSVLLSCCITELPPRQRRATPAPGLAAHQSLITTVSGDEREGRAEYLPGGNAMFECGCGTGSTGQCGPS